MIWCVQADFPEPWGAFWLRFDGRVLTGVRARAQGPFLEGEVGRMRDSVAFGRIVDWLERYFAGERPKSLPPLALTGLSSFGRHVLEAASAVPYGMAVTYGELSARVAPGQPGLARAVGTALGRNPILILVPCHRVLGQGGRLSGYAGGTALKAALLRLEGIAFR